MGFSSYYKTLFHLDLCSFPIDISSFSTRIITPLIASLLPVDSLQVPHGLWRTKGAFVPLFSTDHILSFSEEQ